MTAVSSWYLIFIQMADVSAVLLNTHQPFNNRFGDESQHAESQYEEQDESTELAGVRFAGEIPDDEQHEPDHQGQAPSHTEVGDLFLC